MIQKICYYINIHSKKVNKGLNEKEYRRESEDRKKRENVPHRQRSHGTKHPTSCKASGQRYEVSQSGTGLQQTKSKRYDRKRKSKKTLKSCHFGDRKRQERLEV